MTKRTAAFANHLPGIFDVTPSVTRNHLYYGDNLTIMKQMPSACVDLIYLDPPFNSQRNYNLIYTKLTGQPVPEQEEAFCDAWDLDADKEQLVRKMADEFKQYDADPQIVAFWKAWTQALRTTQPRLLAYLVYMTYRLFEMRKILKPTGSIYLHCDSTASHYIKVIMDGVFGHQNFRNEIIWRRANAHNDPKRYGRITDTLLYYSRSDSPVWNPQYTPYREEYYESHFKKDARGRLYRTVPLDAPRHGEGSPGLLYEWHGKRPAASRTWAVKQETMEEYEKAGLIVYTRTGTPTLLQYADTMPGVPLQNLWNDIPPVNPQARERLGYPTQKPIGLLERIISASSNPGDVVFDPFCGCGTAIYAAHRTGRQWIGCDIAILSVQIVRDVLLKRYGLQEGEHYDVSGVPLSVDGAQDLFERDKLQFQHWAVELAGGFASTKHSGDQGIDGRIHFETGDGLKNMVLSVKGGKQLKPEFVRDVRGVLDRESSAEMAGLICLQAPTRGMKTEAATGGRYVYRGTEYDRIQIRSVQDLLDGRGFDTPSKVQTLSWINQPMLPM